MTTKPNTAKFIETLREYQGNDRMLPFRDVIEEINKRTPPVSQQTRILPTLDRIGSVDPGEIVLIAGSSGEGKTLLLLSLIEAYNAQGHKTGFFSYEQTYKQINKKYEYAPPAFFVPRVIGDDVVYDDFIERMKKDRHSFVGRLPGEPLKWFYIKLMEMIAKGNKPDAVFIDYLHCLLPYESPGKTDPFRGLMRSMQDIAKHYEITIYVVCHFLKNTPERDREPIVKDIRDSGWIINIPDIILLLWRQMNEDGEFDPVSIVKVGKHRREGDSVGTKMEVLMNRRKLLVEKSPEELF